MLAASRTAWDRLLMLMLIAALLTQDIYAKPSEFCEGDTAQVAACLADEAARQAGDAAAAQDTAAAMGHAAAAADDLTGYTDAAIACALLSNQQVQIMDDRQRSAEMQVMLAKQATQYVQREAGDVAGTRTALLVEAMMDREQMLLTSYKHGLEAIGAARRVFCGATLD